MEVNFIQAEVREGAVNMNFDFKMRWHFTERERERQNLLC